MAPKLYMIPASPPVRAVQMTAYTLGIELELVEINLLNKDHLTSEYLKLNPQHTVPTLIDDDGFTIWDSHAIMAYLVSKYGKNDSLYPKDLKKRALIDQRLHFDSGVVFSTLLTILRPIIYQGKKTIEQTDKDALVTAYEFLEAFLEDKQWLAGDGPTIADYSLITTISAANILQPVDFNKLKRLAQWYKKTEALPAYGVSKKGLQAFEDFVGSLLA